MADEVTDEEFVGINEAYNVLSNFVKKAIYDQFGYEVSTSPLPFLASPLVIHRRGTKQGHVERRVGGFT